MSPYRSQFTVQVKRDKIVRKPTAFNHFVKEKIGQYKADGVTIPDDRNNNELFKVCRGRGRLDCSHASSVAHDVCHYRLCQEPCRLYWNGSSRSCF